MTVNEQALYVRTYGTPHQGRTAALYVAHPTPVTTQALAHLVRRVLAASA